MVQSSRLTLPILAPLSYESHLTFRRHIKTEVTTTLGDRCVFVGIMGQDPGQALNTCAPSWDPCCGVALNVPMPWVHYVAGCLPHFHLLSVRSSLCCWSDNALASTVGGDV